MSKTLWHTIQIKVPAEMVELTKSGKISVKKTLTKTFNISRSQKKQAIKLIPANVNHPSIINEGKEWDVNELKLRMKKANDLAKKNKGKDIYKQKKTYKTLDKFESNITNRAKELAEIRNKFKPLLDKIHNAKTKKDKEKAISHYEDVIDFKITEHYQPAKMYEKDPEKKKHIQSNINYIKRLRNEKF